MIVPSGSFSCIVCQKDEKKRYQIRDVYNSINIQIDYFKEQEKMNISLQEKRILWYIIRVKIKKFPILKRGGSRHVWEKEETGNPRDYI